MPDERNSSHHSDYNEGLRDGRLSALENAVGKHGDRFDNHERRLVLIERIIYGMVGILFLSQIWPSIVGLLNGVGTK